MLIYNRNRTLEKLEEQIWEGFDLMIFNTNMSSEEPGLDKPWF
jgi:hypothetical protein